MMKQERIPLARGESWAASRGEGEGARYTPLALLALCGFAFLMVTIVSVDEWPGLFLYLAVAGVLALGLYRRGIAPVDPGFPASLFLLALLLKWSSALVRYWTVVDLYGGAADAPLYHDQGQFVAQYFRALDFSLLNWYQVRGVGTTHMVYIIGSIYSVLPPSFPGSFLLFATLAFTGSVLFYRAVRIAWPDSSARPYLLFIFFSPSVLFWPASLGKDAWIFMNSGLIAWGWVYFVRRSRFVGLAWAGIGLLLIAVLRPHITAFLALSMGSAYLVYSFRHTRSLGTWLLGGMFVGILAIFSLQAGSNFLGIEEWSLDEIRDFYYQQQINSSIGGSEFQTVSIFNPLGIPYGLVTVLFRPFPWEVHNIQAMLSSIESMAWLVVLLHQRRLLTSRIASIRSDPWIIFAATYSLWMIMALTAMGNFGILARQRVMMLPFFWMLFL